MAYNLYTGPLMSHPGVHKFLGATMIFNKVVVATILP